MADRIEISKPIKSEVNTIVNVEIDGASQIKDINDKLEKMLNTMNRISNSSMSKDLVSYWTTQEEAINKVISAYEQFNKVKNNDNALGLVKSINALQGLSETRIDLSKMFSGISDIEKVFENAKLQIGSLADVFDASMFKDVFSTFSYVKEKGGDVNQIFKRLGTDSTQQISQLSKQINQLNTELERTKDELFSAENKLFESDITAMERNIRKLKNSALDEFNNTLKSYNLNPEDTKFESYLNKVMSGSKTVSQAITEIKSEYAELFKENYTALQNGEKVFDTSKLSQFETKLTTILTRVEELSTAMADMQKNGVLTKTVENLSGNNTFNESQLSFFRELLNSKEGIQSISQILDGIIKNSDLLQNPKNNGGLFNESQLASINSTFENIEQHLRKLREVIADVGDGQEFSPLLKTINDITSAVEVLNTSIKGIGLNINVESTSSEGLAVLNEKKSALLSLYKQAANQIALSGLKNEIAGVFRQGESQFVDFNQFGDIDVVLGQYEKEFNIINQKLKAEAKMINDFRKSNAELQNQPAYKAETWRNYTDYGNAITGAKSALTSVKNEMNAVNQVAEKNPLANLFGSSTKEIEAANSTLKLLETSLNNIDKNLLEILSTVKTLSGSSTDTEKISSTFQTLQNQVTSLETELTALKNSTQNIGGKKGASELSAEGSAAEKLATNMQEATSAKENFSTANEKVKNSARESAKMLGAEATSAKDVATAMEKAAKAKANYSSGTGNNTANNASGGSGSGNGSNSRNNTVVSASGSNDNFMVVNGVATELQASFGTLQEARNYFAELLRDENALIRSTQEFGLVMNESGEQAENALTRFSLAIRRSNGEVNNLVYRYNSENDNFEFARATQADQGIIKQLEEIQKKADATREALNKFNADTRGKFQNTNQYQAVNDALNSENDRLKVRRMDQAMKELVSHASEYKRIMSTGSDTTLNQFENQRRDVLSFDESVKSLESSFRNLGKATQTDELKTKIESLKTDLQSYKQLSSEAQTNGTENEARAFARLKANIREATLELERLKNNSASILNKTDLTNQKIPFIDNTDGTISDIKKRFDDFNQLKSQFNWKDLSVLTGENLNGVANKLIVKVLDENDELKKVVFERKQIVNELGEVTTALVANPKETIMSSGAKSTVNGISKVNQALDDTKVKMEALSKQIINPNQFDAINAKVEALNEKLKSESVTMGDKAIKNYTKQVNAITSLPSNLSKAYDKWFNTTERIANLQRQEIKNGELTTSQVEKRTKLESDVAAQKQKVLNLAGQISEAEKNAYSSKLETVSKNLMSTSSEGFIGSSIEKTIENVNKRMNIFANKDVFVNKFAEQFGYLSSKIKQLNQDYQAGSISEKKYADDARLVLQSLSELQRQSSGSVIGQSTTFEEARKAFKDYATTIGKVSKDITFSDKSSNGLYKMNMQVIDAQHNIKNLAGIWSSSANTITVETKHMGTAVSGFQQLTTSFVKKWSQLMQYMTAMYLNPYMLIGRLKTLGNKIIELDTALVDLSKTAKMTKSELNDFYLSSNDTAKQMGVTTKEIIDQASAWSRLGYSTGEQATEMAKLSSQFASISPGMTTDTAQSGLVSIMKAWNIDVKDVEREIMDNINTLGNNFAETNEDIINGMEKAASALAATGTKWTEAFALFTGGQEILQDAQSMGTAIRTVSLRIRGYSENSEDGVLELDESLKNISGDLIDLTKTAKNMQGISIFTDETKNLPETEKKYKSLVEYIGEISDAWDTFSDVQKNSLLQTMFGKTRANAGAALITNFDAVRKSMEAMSEASGSADREMEKIQGSLEFKVNELKETWTGFWQDSIKREDLGNIIEAFTAISEAVTGLISNVGILGSVFGTVGTVLGFKDSGFIKSDTISSLFSGIGKTVTTEIVQPFSGAEEVIRKYNLAIEHNSLTQQGWERLLAQSDNTLSAYLLTLRGSSASMEAYAASLNRNTKGLQNISNTIKQYNNFAIIGKEKQIEFANAIGVTNTKLSGYLVGLNGVKASLIGYASSLVGATVKTIALKTATMALNGLLSYGVSLILTGVISAIGKWVNKDEEIAKKTEEIKSKIEDTNKKLKDHSKLIEECGDRYAELSHKAKDELTTDELNELKDLNEQFTEAFPELIKGFDDQGTAIANIGSNAEETTKKLKEMLEQQKDNANLEIYKSLDDLWESTKVTLDEAIKSQKEFDKEFKLQNLRLAEEKQNRQNVLDNSPLNFGYVIDYSEGDRAIKFYETMSTAIEEFQNKLNEVGNHEYDNELSNAFFDKGTNGQQLFNLDTTYWSDELRQEFINIIDGIDPKFISDYFTEYSRRNISIITDNIGNLLSSDDKSQQDADLAWKDYLQNISKAMQSQASFKQLDDDFQKIAIGLVNSLDRSIYEAGQEVNYDYIRSAIIAPLTAAMNNEATSFEVSKIYNKLLTLNPDDLSTTNQQAITELINKLAELLNKDPIQIRLAFGFDETSLQKDFNAILNKAKNKYEGYQSSNKRDQNGQIKMENTTTGQSIEDWQNLNVVNADQLELWNKCIEACEDYISAIKKYEDEINAVSEKHKTTKSEMIDMIDGISDGFNVLADIYKDIEEGGDFDFSKLNTKKFKEAFEGLEDEYTEFIETVASNPENITACQEAFDNLTTAYIKHKGILNELTEENATLAASYLKTMGVKNADEIVLEALNLQKEKARQDTEQLANATLEEANEMVNEASASEIAQQAIAQLALEKIVVNGTTVNTSADIENIYALAQAARVGSKQLAMLAQAKSILAGVESGSILANGTQYEWAMNVLNDINSGKIGWDFETTDFEYDGPKSPKSSGGGGGSSKDAWLEEYKKKLEILKDQLTEEEITEKEFYAKSEALMNEYLKDTPAHIEKYAKEIEEAQKTLHESWTKAYEYEKKQLSDDMDEGLITQMQYYEKLSTLKDEYYASTTDMSNPVFKADITVSDELKALIDHYSTLQAQIAATGDTSEESKSKLKSALESINLVAEQTGENVEDLIEKTYKSYGKFGDEFKAETKEIREGLSSLFDEIVSNVDSAMDKLQSAFTSVANAIDEYNKDGKLSIDTVQELLKLEPKYRSMLFDEAGQLQLNKEAYEKLAKAKLEEMKIAYINDLTDTIRNLKSEEQMVNFLTTSEQNLVNSTLDIALNAFNQQIEILRSMEGLSAEAANLAEQVAGMAITVKDNILRLTGEDLVDTSTYSSLSGGSFNAKNGTDAAYQREVKNLEHLHNMEMINSKEYYEQMLEFARQYYGEDSDEYRDAEEALYKYLENVEIKDWLEVLLNEVSKTTEKITDKVEKFFTWYKKNNQITKSLKSITNEIQKNVQAYKIYANEANNVKLPIEYKEKVKNGAWELEPMYDEKISRYINKYKEWYDKAQACLDKMEELYDKQRELIRQRLDSITEQYSEMSGYLNTMVDSYKDILSLNKAMGKRDSLDDLVKQFGIIRDYIADATNKNASSSMSITKKLVNKIIDETPDLKTILEKEHKARIEALKSELVKLDAENSGVIKNIDKQIEKKEAQLEKLQDKGKDTTKLEKTINDLYDLRSELSYFSDMNTVAQYESIYKNLQKLQNKLDLGKTLSSSEQKRFNLYQEQLDALRDKVRSTKADINQQLKDLGEEVSQPTALEEIVSKYKDAFDVSDSDTFNNLLNQLEKFDEKIAKYNSYDSLTKSQQKAYDKLLQQREALADKIDFIDKNATDNTIDQYNKIYDVWKKLQDKLDSGANLSNSEKSRYINLQTQMNKIANQVAHEESDYLQQKADQEKANLSKDSEEIKKIRNELDRAENDVKDTAIYRELDKKITDTEAQLEAMDQIGYDYLTKSQKKTYDKLTKNLEDYSEQRQSIEENSTAATIAEYNKIYLAHKKLQDKLDAGGNLSTSQWTQYRTYQQQLAAFAKTKADTVQDLKDMLEELVNPSTETEAIEKAKKKAVTDLRQTYMDNIADINSSATSTQTYQNLYSEVQRLQQKQATKKLSTSEQNNLTKYVAELQAMQEGAMADNINEYKTTWEKWYSLELKRQKLEPQGKILTGNDAKNYDAYAAQLDAWKKTKQNKITELQQLLEDDMAKLEADYEEKIAEAEKSVNDYYKQMYELAKSIAEYNISTLEAQKDAIESTMSLYQKLISMYEKFDGNKLTNLLSALDQDTMKSQEEVYQEYLNTLHEKYQNTLDQISEYKNLIEAIKPNENGEYDFSSAMKLFQNAMDKYNSTGQTEMADYLNSVIKLLNERMAEADEWDLYADEWATEWKKALESAQEELIDTAESVQEIDDALRELSMKPINDMIKELERLQDRLSSITSLYDEEWLFNSKTGELNEFGTAKVTMIVQELLNAQQEAEKYQELMQKIQASKDTYASDDAYKEALSEVESDYYNAITNIKGFEDELVSLMSKTNESIINSLKELIEKRKEALQAQKDLYEYNKKISDSQKEIDNIKAQIDAMETLTNATDAATKAKLAQLNASLEEKEKALQETKDEHVYELQINSLDNLIEDLDKIFNNTIDSINVGYDKFTNAINSALDVYNSNQQYIGQWSEDIIKVITQFDRRLLERTETIYDNGSNDHSISTSMGELTPILQSSATTLATSLSSNIVPSIDLLYDVTKSINDNMQSIKSAPTTININYDNLLNVEGNIDKAIMGDMNEWLKQACDYTKNSLYSELSKLGFSSI